MADDFTLYYFPSSYFSLKAYLALQEKGVPFKERVVNMMENEHFKEWFLKINPKGEVPVLQHGSKFIPDSEAIIDYIDAHFTEGPSLVPDPNTPEGKDVRELRQILHRVPIDNISFGVLCNRNFCTSQPKFPRLMLRFIHKDRAVKGLRDRIETLRASVNNLPLECKAEAVVKIRTSEERLAIIQDEDAVAGILDDLEKVFDTIESHLEKSNKECSDSSSFWLIGSTFTVVDIIATCLMYRLYLVGIDERYFSDTKRPLVKDYFNRLRKRPAVKRTIELSESSWKFMAKTVLKKVAKVGLFVGVLALGLIGAREGFKKLSSDSA